jgi:hypothetical protein
MVKKWIIKISHLALIAILFLVALMVAIRYRRNQQIPKSENPSS